MEVIILGKRPKPDRSRTEESFDPVVTLKVNRKKASEHPAYGKTEMIFISSLPKCPKKPKRPTR
jgi:hypothetical protein